MREDACEPGFCPYSLFATPYSLSMTFSPPM